MRCLRLICAIVGLGTAPIVNAASPPPPIHAIFVGINSYAHSRQGDPQGTAPAATFDNLNGAVGDVRRFKQTLREVYKLDLDQEDGSDCRSANAVSVTLTDRCATRDAIFKAIASQIATARQGETVLLYFAGHGTAEPESAARRQASGFNSTFVPYDARDEDMTVPVIFDVEFAVFRNRANRRGVNFVMVFDSCHSGTIGRDGKPLNPAVVTAAREVPSLSQLGLSPMPPQDVGSLADTYSLPPELSSITPGYWLSLGASDDSELAQELVGRSGAVASANAGSVPDWVPGEPAGVFTTALVAAIRRNPAGTFADFIEDARIRILELGIRNQNPRADGDYQQRLGGGRTGLLTYQAMPAGSGLLRLESGSLSGITEGSSFSVFATDADAMAETPVPLATGSIARVGPYNADLRLDGGVAQLLGRRFVTVETAHNWGVQRISVGFRDRLSPADSTKFDAMLRPFAFIGREAPLQTTLNFVGASRNVELRDATGALLRTMGSFDAPGFSDALGATLRLMLRSRILLGLRTPGASKRPAICVVASDYVADNCAGQDPAARNSIQVRAGEFKVVVRNQEDDPRRIYVLGVSPDGMKVIPVLPPPGSDNAPIGGHKVVESDRFYFSKPGAWRFIVIASANPVNTAALEQRGLTARDPAKCASNISRTLCAAGAGNVDPGVVAKPDWTAAVTTIKVNGSNGE